MSRNKLKEKEYMVVRNYFNGFFILGNVYMKMNNFIV